MLCNLKHLFKTYISRIITKLTVHGVVQSSTLAFVSPQNKFSEKHIVPSKYKITYMGLSLIITVSIQKLVTHPIQMQELHQRWFNSGSSPSKQTFSLILQTNIKLYIWGFLILTLGARNNPRTILKTWMCALSQVSVKHRATEFQKQFLEIKSSSPSILFDREQAFVS